MTRPAEIRLHHVCPKGIAFTLEGADWSCFAMALAVGNGWQTHAQPVGAELTPELRMQIELATSSIAQGMADGHDVGRMPS